MLICLAIGISTLSEAFTINAEAKESYRPLTFKNDIAKSGKYYFKYIDGNVYISKKRNSGYKWTPIEGAEVYTNGHHAFYVQNNALYKYIFSSGKEIRLKRFSKQDPSDSFQTDYFYINDIYGSQIFVQKTYTGSGTWTHTIYSYNIKTKKYKKVLSNCVIIARYDKYVVGRNRVDTSGGPVPLTLYRIKGSKFEKIKRLSSSGRNATFVDKKLYYVEYPNYWTTGTKAVLYRCNLDGSGRKKLGVFSISPSTEYDNHTQLYHLQVSNITSKSCEISTIEGRFRYTYATKKLKKLKR